MKDIQSILLQKNGRVLINLAQRLLDKDIGDKMDTIIKISEELSVGRGTVQTAIKHLQNFGAISFETKGHLGTIITGIDYGILMDISGINSVVGVMPLPYSKRYEGLATGIYNTLNSKSAIVNLAFMAGAERRIQFLLDKRYDFCVMSKFTAEYYISQNMPIEIISTLGNRTYVSDHTLIVKNEFEEFFDDMKIGIDNSSFDQTYMTKKYFEGKNIEIVPIKYNQIIESIKNGDIDGSIWSLEEEVINDKELRCHEICKSDENMENTQAVIVVRNDEIGIKNYFNRCFDSKKVERIQQSVIQNKIMPNY